MVRFSRLAVCGCLAVLVFDRYGVAVVTDEMGAVYVFR